ncbi:hypothetical protein H6F89_28510 [Cyanobacteria bacterium FACHB-63]|nr:hypothetical protein [Cyanobacteria bacterium FACHB-63]
MHPVQSILAEMHSETEQARSRAAKAALLKKLNDFRSLHQNRTGNIRLDREDVMRLLEMNFDRAPAISRKLSNCKHEWGSQITLMPHEIDFLLREIEHYY